MPVSRRALLAALALPLPVPAANGALSIWHGDTQRVGHLGDAQDDFNLMGHVEPWRDVDQLTFRINNEPPIPLAYRAYRRLVNDGDFNADIPVGRLKQGANTIEIAAAFRDGSRIAKAVTLHRDPPAPAPTTIRWSQLKHFQQAGQAVDGHWQLTPNGLRTREIGYDRVFLIGNRTWQDYDVRTSVTLHKVAPETSAISGGNGLGIILRFAGHIAGGHRFFPSGQPKWGYQPFGAIGWLRWTKGKPNDPPQAQFYPGDRDRWVNKQPFPVTEGETYSLRFACQTLPDTPAGEGVTRYRFKAWETSTEEPAEWTWEHLQTSAHALRAGGFTLLAHHIDATFHDIEVLNLETSLGH